MKKYSVDEELYDIDCLDEAVTRIYENDFNPKIGDIYGIWEGDTETCKASDFTGYMYDVLGERFYEDFGSEYEWPSANPEEILKLEQAIKETVDRWAKENNQDPKMSRITDDKEIKVKITSIIEGDFTYEIIEN